MKPKILLSANAKMEYYVDAVNRCGGIADASYCPEVSTEYDGLLICGGNDIHPKYYGEDIDGSVNIDEERDIAEMALAKAFIEANKPVMGICRGMQMINIVLGGSMYQDIPEANLHSSGDSSDLAHSVKAIEGSICHELYGEEFSVNSHHHQAVNRVGDGLRVTVTADNVIEALEHTKLPIFGVQWHPERMCFSQKRDDTVDGSLVIGHFVEMCKKNMADDAE